MYTVVISCTGLPKHAGAEAAADITKEFAQHRPWHKDVSCTWDGSRLILTAQNDYDSDGLALMDEFSDCICAYVAEATYSDMRVDSVTKHDDS